MTNLELSLLKPTHLKSSIALFAAISMFGCTDESDNQDDYDLYYNGVPSSKEASQIDVSSSPLFSIEHNFTEQFDLFVGTTAAVKAYRQSNPGEHMLVAKQLSQNSFSCSIDDSYVELSCSFNTSPEDDISLDISELVTELPTHLYLYASIELDNGEVVSGYKLTLK